MTDISVVIVAYNNEEDVRQAVCSLLEHTAADIQKKIYIVDNSSQPNHLKEAATQWEDTEYFQMESNLGFGGGHNFVLPMLDSTYHAIVNPDIVLKEDSLGILMHFLEDTGAGMVVPRLLGEDGKLQKVYRRELTVFDMGIRMFLPGCFQKRQDAHTMQDMDYSRPFPVPFAQGSFLVIRTSLFQELRGFDSRYFMYMEDADLCRRVNQVSRLLYCPDTEVIHRWERGSHKDGSLRKVHIRSMIQYFQKWGWCMW